MPELLIELFSEEIPARMQGAAARQLEKAVNAALIDAGYLPAFTKGFGGPRRLTVVAGGLPERQADREEEKKGPRLGAPDKAIEGFLKSVGFEDIGQCAIASDKKGEYYVARRQIVGRSTPAVIADFLPEIIRQFAWPKSMRWADRELKWVRPLKRILCVFNAEVVPFDVGGLRAGDETEGHRFMAPSAFAARDFDHYTDALRSAFVMLDSDERKGVIARDAATLCEAQGLEIIEDQGLVEENAGLVEWPAPLIGAFNPKFLDVPDEALIASMRGHQKYFSARDPKTGRLAPRFVAIANLEARDGGAAMKAGYERVLEARLADALFLYRQDAQTPLEARLAALDDVVYFKGLGTLGDKARRVSERAREFAPAFGADPDQAARAGLLAKADLTTGMVYEFPELQGVMGHYYALAQGETPEIAQAIRDHYAPAGASDAPPTTPVSAVVAFADKLDTLTSFFSIGETPTGSSDPFALRRAALGVIRILFGTEARLSLPTADQSLLAFVHERLTAHLRAEGARHDVVAAARRDADGDLRSDLVQMRALVHALAGLLGTDEGGDLAAAYKRAANILKAEQKSDATVAAGDVKAELLRESDERALFDSLDDAERAIESAMRREAYGEAMTALSRLRAPLDAFFENVTVNADDPDLRVNRLALLKRLSRAMSKVADFSALEG